MEPSSPTTPTTYTGLVEQLVEIISLLVIALFAFAFVYFIWKMIDCWVIHAGDDKKRTEGRQYAVAAVLALVVMTGVWGIVTIVRTSIFGTP